MFLLGMGDEHTVACPRLRGAFVCGVYEQRVGPVWKTEIKKRAGGGTSVLDVVTPCTATLLRFPISCTGVSFMKQCDMLQMKCKKII